MEEERSEGRIYDIAHPDPVQFLRYVGQNDIDDRCDQEGNPQNWIEADWRAKNNRFIDAVESRDKGQAAQSPVFFHLATHHQDDQSQ